MSHWNIAAAQYRLNHHRVDEHIAHHLRFISAASKLECNLVLFPELSLTGPALPDGQLPAPPDSHQLAPLVDAACAHNVSVIAGTTVEVRESASLAWPGLPRTSLMPPFIPMAQGPAWRAGMVV